MRFNSKSVALNGGCRVKFDVYIPTALLDVEISDEIWQIAIDDFNKKLDARPTVTTKINEVAVDVLKLESVEDSIDYLKMGAVILLIVAKEEDIPRITDIHFCLTGYLTFQEKSDKVDGMVINNITYGGDDGKKFRILDDNDGQ
jgi:hypothetical protein